MNQAGGVIVNLPNGEEREFQGDSQEIILELIDGLSSSDWPDAMVVQGRHQDAGWMHIFHAIDFGWLVVCCGASDSIEHFLTMGEDLDRVQVRKAGLIEDYARNQFVSRDMALEAISEFLRTKERDARLEWRAIGGDGDHCHI